MKVPEEEEGDQLSQMALSTGHYECQYFMTIHLIVGNTFQLTDRPR